MAAAAVPLITSPPAEQRIVLHNVAWKDYVVVRDVLGGPGVRMTYLHGALELMSPSPLHELWKKNIARLVELYAHVRGVELYGYGSTTFKREAKQRGAEPDECYLVGKKLADYPEIVLEVIQSSPLVDKLDVYAGLGVSEVWVFCDGAFAVHVLDAQQGRFAVRASSALLPGLDFTVLARYAVREDTPQALREYEAAVRR